MASAVSLNRTGHFPLWRWNNAYAVVGGIDLDPQRPGYKHIIMRPQPGSDLTSARAELYSMYGLIRSAWTQENDVFSWQITVPANSTATVYVPVAEGAKVRESDIPASIASGVRFLRREAAAEVYEVAAGEYHFIAS